MYGYSNRLNTCNIKYAGLFQRLEEEAREQRLGMWSHIVTTPTDHPVDMHEYVASKSSEVFHLPSCTWADRVQMAIGYTSIPYRRLWTQVGGRVKYVSQVVH